MKIGNLYNVVKAFISKNSPYIISGIGAASVATGAVILVKKAKKQNEFDEEVKTIYEEKKQGIEVYGAANNIPADKREKIYRKNIVKLNIWKTGKYTGYYATPVILISGGVMCMLSALLIQTKRIKALSVAYTSLATAFNDYRDRVKTKFGLSDQEEEDLFNGVERDRNGNIVSSSRESTVENETVYSRLFGEGNSWRWVKNTNLCVLILMASQTNLNELLRLRGYVTLNDVWKELGFKPSSEGMYLGWRFKKNDPVFGSTYIDLGFSKIKNAKKIEALKNSWNEEIWIDVIPPHVLLDILPKEKLRTEEEKKKIKQIRKGLGSNESDGSEYLTDSNYMAEKTLSDIKRAEMMV